MTLPPYAKLLGITIQPGQDGPILTMPFGEEVIGRPGFLHGGAIAGLLELAAMAALHQALKEQGGGRIKPITTTADFQRGGRDKPTRAAGIVTRLGTRIANVQATAWQDERERPIASARLNFLIERDQP